MAPRRNPLVRWAKEYPFGVLLGALLLIIIGAPLTESLNRTVPFFHGQEAIAPLVLTLTLASAYAVWPAARSRTTTIVLGGIVIAMLYVSTIFRHNSLTAVHLVAQTVFLGYVIAVVTRRVFAVPIIDGNVLFGAAALYLLLGVLAGFLFSLIELAQPGSFFVHPAGERDLGDPINPSTAWLIYYSFTTLTTVGFGDVLPASDLARSASICEAVIGQMLLVVMMARLVGLHVAQVSSRPNQPTVFETSSEPVPRKKP